EDGLRGRVRIDESGAPLFDLLTGLVQQGLTGIVGLLLRLKQEEIEAETAIGGSEVFAMSTGHFMFLQFCCSKNVSTLDFVAGRVDLAWLTRLVPVIGRSHRCSISPLRLAPRTFSSWATERIFRSY